MKTIPFVFAVFCLFISSKIFATEQLQYCPNGLFSIPIFSGNTKTAEGHDLYTLHVMPSSFIADGKKWTIEQGYGTDEEILMSWLDWPTSQDIADAFSKKPFRTLMEYTGRGDCEVVNYSYNSWPRNHGDIDMLIKPDITS